MSSQAGGTMQNHWLGFGPEEMKKVLKYCSHNVAGFLCSGS